MNLLRMRKPGPIRGEDGQTMTLFAGLAVLMIAAVGLVIDAGRVVGTRAEFQKAADAAALAAAQDLPNGTAATVVASQYVSSNARSGVTTAVTVTSKNYPNDTVAVSVTGRVNYSFLRAFGMTGTSVSAKAVTRRSVFRGGWSLNLVPWGLVTGSNPNSALRSNECYEGTDAFGLPIFKTHTRCNIKYGSGYTGGGEFGALQLDGTTGADAYADHIANGTKIDHYVGDTLGVESGNMQGPTRQGVFDRLAEPPPPGCPSNKRTDVLIDNADGTVSIRPGCERTARLVAIPIVDGMTAGQKSTILGFAMMWIYGMLGPDGVVRESGQGTGQDKVQGEFVQLVTRVPGGGYGATFANGASVVEFIE